MSKDPAFLFYSSDFLTGCIDLTMEEIGQYITLLCMQHQKGRLTKKHMLMICNSLDNDVCKKFIIDSDCLYYNKRLEEESVKRKNYSESRRNNRKGKTKNKSYDKTYDTHMENENENENENEIKDVRFIKPTIEQIQNYCIEKNNNIDVEYFYNHYESNGWKVGRNKMKDWKATVNQWISREKKRNNNNIATIEDGYSL